MEKGDVLKYLIIGLVFVGLASILIVLKPAPTGYVVLGDYITEQDCIDNAGFWYEEVCYDAEPVCSADFLELCDDTNCAGVGGVWEDVVIGQENCLIDGCDVCEPDCLNLCVDGCAETETCEPDCVMSEYLCVEGCLENCTDIPNCILCGGCVVSEDLCVDGCLGDCACVEGDENCVCDDITEKQCVECVPKTCADYPNQCGSALDDGCNGTIDCSSACSSGYECSAGSCVQSCVLDCSGKDCGSDGCGGSCGSCSSSESCDDGTCVSDDTSSASDVEGTPVPFVKAALVGDVNVNAGGTVDSLLIVKNIGLIELFNCKLKSEGDASSWISSNVIANLASMDDANFTFSVDVPVTIPVGTYIVDLAIECGTADLNEHVQPVNIIVSKQAGITGETISEGEETEGKAGITGLAIFEGTSGKVTVYVIFLLVLAAAVFLVWRRRGQIPWVDASIRKIKGLFNR